MIDPSLFRRQWPRPLILEHLDPFEVSQRQLSPRKSWWRRHIYEFVSERWGSIIMPHGSITDLASIPRGAELIDPMLDADSPLMAPASQPHDFTFQPVIVDGKVTRGWIDPPSAARPRRLSLTHSNELLVEAMRSRGATDAQCAVVYAAVQLANLRIAHEFAP